jgi:pyrroloquinoline quinone biosynthesis protein B
LNASPDLRQQIAKLPPLQPQTNGGRHTPIKTVILTNGDVDHITGLLSMREMQAFTIHCSDRVKSALDKNAVFNVLNAELVTHRSLPLDQTIDVVDAEGASMGFTIHSFVVPGKIALWLEDLTKADFGSVAGDTVGLKITDIKSGKSFFYIPGCASLPPEVAARLEGADLVFFDGTTWTDNEMVETGVGTKTASRMGHMWLSGPGGSMEAFAPLGVKRKIFIHINNTNPVLIADTAQRKEANAKGWEISYDGMEVVL